MSDSELQVMKSPPKYGLFRYESDLLTHTPVCGNEPAPWYTATVSRSVVPGPSFGADQDTLLAYGHAWFIRPEGGHQATGQ